MTKLFEVSIQDPAQDPIDLLLVRYYIFLHAGRDYFNFQVFVLTICGFVVP